MIIQCEQCRTKFKLDDNKVTERGAKVRCAKCRHVFTVRKTEVVPPEVALSAPETPETPLADAATGFDTGAISFADVAIDETPLAVSAPTPPSATAASGLDFGTVVPQTRDMEPSPEISFDFGEVHPSSAAPQNIAFDFTSKPASVAAVSTGDIDFGSFDFGDVSVAKPDDSFSLDNAEFGGLTAASQASPADDGDLGFSFGDAAPQAVPTPAGGFDFSNMDFSSPQPASAPAGDSFSLGEFEFGTEAARVAMPADAEQDDALFSFGQAAAPAATVPDEPAPAPFSFEPVEHGEAPPLSIASRRRQSPIISALIVAACLLLVGALGFMGYLFLGDGSKTISLFGKGTPVDEGKIVVQKVEASFLTKTAAGDLLIITGEALNSFSKPRAALQLKATLYGDNNEQVVSQLAYAGNQLTREQLATMPREKIEAAMNNQFGDSLANLEVPPGKTIPFTLVIVNPPVTAKDYGVEAVGSTIAASK